MADVFISYSSKNRDSARALAASLNDLGLSVWWDREILTGEAFDKAIERELDSAKCVVVLWSKDSVESEWVKNEAASALQRGALLPANLDGVILPLEFRRRQTADLSGWSGEPGHEGFRALCRSIKNFIEKGGAPAPGPQAAEAPATKRDKRRPLVGAVLVGAIVLALAGLYQGLTWQKRQASGPAAASQQSTAPTTPSRVTNVDLADLVAGSYLGAVISDSRGSSRSNIVVTLSKQGTNTIRVSSPYARIGSFDVELTQIDRKILGASGDTPFMVDLQATPPTLSLNPRNELAYTGVLQK